MAPRRFVTFREWCHVHRSDARRLAPQRKLNKAAGKVRITLTPMRVRVAIIAVDKLLSIKYHECVSGLLL